MNLLEIIQEYCRMRDSSIPVEQEYAHDCLSARIEQTFPEEEFKKQFKWKKGDKVHDALVDLFFLDNWLAQVSKLALVKPIIQCYEEQKKSISSKPQTCGYKDGSGVWCARIAVPTDKYGWCQAHRETRRDDDNEAGT